MDKDAGSGPGPVRPRLALVGIKYLVLLVACSGASFWAVRAVRESARPSLGLARLLRSGNASDREQAAAQLYDVGPDQVGVAIPALVAALDDEDPAVSVSATRSLGAVGALAAKSPATVPEARVASEGLTRALRHANDEVRSWAVIGLKMIAEAAPATDLPFNASAVAEGLADVLRGPSGEGRAVAVQALTAVAKVAPIEPPPALLEALTSGASPDDRANAAMALGYIHGKSETVIGRLTAALKDPAPEVVQAAISALGQRGPEARSALPDLIAILNRPYVAPSEPKAGATSGRLGPRPRAADPGSEAALAIGSIAKGGTPAPEAVAALEQTLRSGHPSRRPSAAEALFRLGNGAAPAIPTLIQTVKEGSRPDGDDGFESWAARSLGQVAPGTPLAGQTVEALTAALEAKAPGMRAYSAEALGLFGPAASGALPRLRALKDDPDTFVAGKARAAIEQIEADAGSAR
jgi:HEAT repeat protein